MGLRLRLILVLLIPPILVVGVYGFIRVRMERAELLDSTQRSVALTGRTVQIAVERALRDPQTTDLQGLLSEIVHDQQQIDGILIFDRSLTSTLVANRVPVLTHASTEVLDRVIRTGQPEGAPERRDRRLVFFYVVPLRAPAGTVVGAMEVVHVGADIDAQIRSGTWDVVIRLTLLVVSIAVLTVVMLRRQVFRPLHRLMKGIRDLGRGTPGTPLPVERRDELGRVAEAFNTMAAQLQAARHKLMLETERALDLEQQLRHSATLAVAGRLATGLAHEVGTPLNIISGRAELLLSSLPGDDGRRDELNVIIGQIDRISAMIRSLLDTVRPVKPHIEAIRIHEVVGRLLLLLEHTARRHGVALEVHVADDLPEILADRNQFQQVLINLLMNAFEAVRPAGTVKVVAAAAVREGRPGVDIAIADTGPGIPPGVLSRIFDPFFSTKPAGEGTGLGLPICRDIVREHDGRIYVTSTPGAGTTFVVWFAEDTEFTP